MDVALVGLLVPGIENHSLAALAHAVRAANREVVLVPFDGFAHLEQTLASVLRAKPRVCGISKRCAANIGPPSIVFIPADEALSFSSSATRSDASM